MQPVAVFAVNIAFMCFKPQKAFSSNRNIAPRSTVVSHWILAIDKALLTHLYSYLVPIQTQIRFLFIP